MGHVHTDQCDKIEENCNRDHEHNDWCYKVTRICGQLTDYEIEQQDKRR
jgi:hypothetical protein